jgi:hypothetical protein
MLVVFVLSNAAASKRAAYNFSSNGATNVNGGGFSSTGSYNSSFSFSTFHSEFSYRDAEQMFNDFFEGKDPFDAFFEGRDPMEEFMKGKNRENWCISAHLRRGDSYYIHRLLCRIIAGKCDV